MNRFQKQWRIKPTKMKTGKMKQVIYSIALIMLLSLNASANNNALSEMNLKAAVVQNSAEVSWKAFTQINVRRYELEKSTDGENFSYVTAVASNAKKYSVQDRNFTEGINYYRLKVIDNNGNALYTKTVSLNKGSNFEEIKIMPGVVTDELYIWIPANTQISNAVVTDMSGRKVNRYFAINNVTNAASVKLGRLPAGMYNITVATSTGITTNLKFAKK